MNDFYIGNAGFLQFPPHMGDISMRERGTVLNYAVLQLTAAMKASYNLPDGMVAYVR